MDNHKVYEYAVIRVVPRVERGEFVNVGVILFCKDLKYTGIILKQDKPRWQALFGDINCKTIKANLDAFAAIAKGEYSAGPIAQLDDGSRFRWLTARRSTIIQCSAVHPGLTIDPEATLKSLFSQLVD